MIPFNNRFHGHSSLNYVYKNGVAIRSHLITIKTINNPHRKMSRVAVVIGKKVLKSAVGRNRIRRRIYEYIRPRLSQLNGVHDIVIIVTSGELLNISTSDLLDQLNQLMKQTDIQKTS